MTNKFTKYVFDIELKNLYPNKDTADELMINKNTIIFILNILRIFSMYNCGKLLKFNIYQTNNNGNMRISGEYISNDASLRLFVTNLMLLNDYYIFNKMDFRLIDRTEGFVDRYEVSLDDICKMIESVIDQLHARYDSTLVEDLVSKNPPLDLIIFNYKKKGGT